MRVAVVRDRLAEYEHIVAASKRVLVDGDCKRSTRRLINFWPPTRLDKNLRILGAHRLLRAAPVKRPHRQI